MKYYAIIVAGGSGKRMQGDLPKQFMSLANQPILFHTLNAFAFHPLQPEIILALPADALAYWKELCEQASFKTPHQLVIGGKERYDTVKNALKEIKEPGLVAVHDAVRPLLSAQLISKLYEAASLQGSAIPYIKSSDSLRHLSPAQSGIINRDEIALVQTPQIFASESLLQAYELPYRPSFTDDASVIESAGFPIQLIEGERENLKITYPMDLKLAELILKDLNQ